MAMAMGLQRNWKAQLLQPLEDPRLRGNKLPMGSGLLKGPKKMQK